ncbi:hypothetical protein PybrP1_004554 [[Pythium] brassicae (nom. inval.)]|nr:hypothetical protein PybrP1_004554 [[Pythium] brassicae (nom. inval.)]
MGQAGSVEQKAAIRDVVALKSGGEKEAALAALQTFCRMFPLEQPVAAPEDAFDVKDRKLFDIVLGLLQEQTERTERGANEDLIEQLLVSFKRVIRWRELYRLCAKCSLKPFLSCLRLSPKLQLAVLDTLLAVVRAYPGVELSEKADKWETANRRNFGDSGGFEQLRALLVQYSAEPALSADKELILSHTLQLFHLALVTRRSTTDLLTCNQVVGALLNARISLLDLCHHPSLELQDAAIDLVKELFVLIDLEQVHELQESAREYGALLYALATAVSETTQGQTDSEDDGVVDDDDGQLTPTNAARVQQDKCIDLVELFCAGNTRSKKAMYRIFPVELFIPAESRLDLISRHTASSASRALVGGAFERWLGDARSQGEQWRNIIEAVLVDHARPELVWRDEMRSELRRALHAEIAALERKRRLPDDAAAAGGRIARWDHEMFYVSFQSIQRELVVNGYFVEHLIPMIADLANSYEVVEPIVLAWHLSDQLAVEPNAQRKLLCVRCLRLVIRRYAMLFHGQLPTRQVLAMLESHSSHALGFVRECLLLLNTAIATTRNAPSESLNRLSALVASAVVNVLSDPGLISTLSSSRTCSTLDTEDEDSDDEGFVDCDDEQGFVNNDNDGLLRAGLTVLLAVVRRSKYTLLLVRPKRVFLCRLLAVETLDHITISQVLTLLKQLAVLDSSAAGSSLSSPSAAGKVSASDANWKSLALVYVLFASCDPNGMGMCLQAAEFLREHFAVPTRMSRAASGSGTGATTVDRSPKSELHDILDEALGFGGCGMGPLLASSSAEAFADVFNAHEKRAADVMWGRKQRIRLFRYLKNKYVAVSSENQHAFELSGGHGSFGTGGGAADDDGEDDDDIFIGNIFIQSYIEGDGQFLTEWTFGMYTSLLNELFLRLMDLGRAKSVFGASGSTSPVKRSRSEPWRVQVMILKALVKLVPTNCADVAIQKEHYESLLAPLRRSLLGESDQVRGILALELFIAILSAPQDRSVNTPSCRQFLEERGLAVLSEALERMLHPSYQQLLKSESEKGVAHTARVLLYRVTDVLTTLSAQPAGIRAIEKNPRVVSSLLELSSRTTILSYSEDAAAVCLNCLSNLCFYDELRAVVVESGGLLHLIETSAFCPADDVAETAASVEDTSRDAPVVLQRRPSRHFSAVRGAALTLRACLNEKNFNEAAPTFQVLKQLLTPSFVRILRVSPERFISQLQSTEDINSPTLVWTSSMRARLRDCLSLELSKLKTAARADVWPRWDPDHFIAADSFRYQYPELADELIIHDVYLNNFVASAGIDLDDISMSSFSEALLISIQSNENVLRILQQRGSSDQGREVSIAVMRQALSKLVSAHPQHNLEVDSAPLSDSAAAAPASRKSSGSRSSEGRTPPATAISSRSHSFDPMSPMDLEDLTV